MWGGHGVFPNDEKYEQAMAVAITVKKNVSHPFFA
jgi:hypothetical protein